MSHTPVLGGELLRLVTSGMYDNPLNLYREYVQNAADAIAAQSIENGFIKIAIDPVLSNITILDNGTGMTPSDAVQRLTDLGQSSKDVSVDRGFRGIGRLSALAFADELHFTTRTRADDHPIRVSWSAKELRELDLKQVNAKEAIQQCTSTTLVRQGDWPDRFFQVTIDKVNRHAASIILNEDVVRRYLSEVCPVPMASTFPLADDIVEFLTAFTPNLVLDIRINEDERPLERPFHESISITEDYDAPFDSLETRLMPSLDSESPAAVLWLAHTSYSGSISRQHGVRGLRARIGNLQVGTDRVFEHLFIEPRFNGWCVGELHVLDHRIVPNGRRDYFEPSSHLRNLENHIGALAHDISLRCRRASSQRNKLRNLAAVIQEFRSATDLANSGVLREEDAITLVARERKRLTEIRKTLAGLEVAASPHPLDEIAHCEQQLYGDQSTHNPTFSSVSRNTRSILETTFGTIVRTVPPDVALRLIETILHNLSDIERTSS